MRKLDKRAISILVIATFLISMIPIMPAQADMGDIYVSGYPKITDYPEPETLLSIGIGTADYAYPPSPVLSGDWSVELDPGTADTDAGRIWIPVASIPFKDFVEPTFMVWEPTGAAMGGSYDPLTGLPETGDTYYPYGHPYVNINLDLNGDGTYPTYGDDKLEAVGSMRVGGGAPTAETWTEMQEAWGYYDGDNGIDDASATPSAFSGHFVVHTFAEWKTYMLAEFPNAEVIGIEVTFGFWPGIVTNPVYVDDVDCMSAFTHFEYEGVDQGDILVISGSGVTSGAPVNLYWDYVTTAGLVNNTVANPDGTYELDLKIPSDVGGNHYIWVKDVGTGETKMYPTAIFVLPKLSLSPSSGLVGDEITVKGYGFAPENDVTIIWDSGGTPITKTTTVETNELGYVTYKFDVPTGTDYGDYYIDATDDAGWTATKKYTVGASITLTPDEGPTGTKVKVEGRGWSAGETITFAIGTTTVEVVDAKIVTVKSGGTFSADIIIPDMSSKGDYEVEATETDVGLDGAKGPSHDHFEIDGLPKIKVNPTYGTPGAIITVTGSNFTQITGTIVTVTLDSIPESVLIDDAETKSDGTFEATFISPAVTFTTYDVTATDEYSIDADDAFKVGLIALILNPVSGESGTMVSLTGIGFANGDYNVTFASSDESYTKLYEDYGTVSGEAIADPFYVPNVDPGTYYLTISDTDDNELTSTYTVTESTYVIVKPALAPVKYNVSLKGYHFADWVADVDFVIYNVTSDGEVDEDWDMTVQTTTGDTTPPDVDDTATDIDGNFTGWWKVDEDLSNGDYIINVTGGKGLLVQIDFSVVSARVSVTPRKALFARGDTVSFDISNDFPIEGTIEIYDPNEILYWITDLLYDGVGETDDVWVLVEGLETVPYYSQTANANPMELASDAPLGTWTYFFYEGTKELMNSTFVVGASAAAQIDELMEDVRTDISDLAADLAGVTDDVEDDIATLSDEIAGVASDLETLGADIAGDLADDIAAATDAGQAALGAVEDLAGSMRDLGDAVSDIADIAGDAADAAQSAADASNEATQAAQEAKDSAGGLTTLVYGAIGASLIAALAAIVSLMQISRRIAG